MKNMNYKTSLLLVTFLLLGAGLFANKKSCPAALDSVAFVKLLSKVEANDFDGGKVTLIKETAKGICYSSEQIKALLDLLSFEEDKIALAKYLWDHVNDPANFLNILSVFEFESSKKEIRAHIAASK